MALGINFRILEFQFQIREKKGGKATLINRGEGVEKLPKKTYSPRPQSVYLYVLILILLFHLQHFVIGITLVIVNPTIREKFNMGI